MQTHTHVRPPMPPPPPPPRRAAAGRFLDTLFVFYARRAHAHAHTDKHVPCVCPPPPRLQAVFFDPNTLSEDGTVAMGDMQWSDDGSLAAYSLSSGGSDWSTIRVGRPRTGGARGGGRGLLAGVAVLAAELAAGICGHLNNHSHAHTRAHTCAFRHGRKPGPARACARAWPSGRLVF